MAVKFLARFDTTVDGIHCEACVTYYHDTPAMRDDPGGLEVEYLIFLHGRRAEWIEKKITDEIDLEITDIIRSAMEEG